MSKKKVPNPTPQPSQSDHLAELENDLKRVQADFINYRRRQEDERGQILDLAKQDVVSQILPLLDNIDRALGHLPQELANNSWAQGVEQVAKQAGSTLKTMGVEVFGKVGDSFDPNLHEAIAYELYDSGSKELRQSADEFVSEVLQPGYKLGRKIIRHAMVKVGRKQSNKAKEQI